MTAAFDSVFPRKPAMTADEAKSIVAEMMAETPRPAMIKLIKLALKAGNLTDEAKSVYRSALQN